MPSVHIQRLSSEARGELLELFTEAFSRQVLMPGMAQDRASVRALMSAFLRFYGRSESLALRGIRRGGQLACGAVTVDFGEEASLLAAVPFFFRLTRALGWRTTLSFGTIEKHQPKYDRRHLELALLGTAPSFQGQGFGRQMLDLLCEECRRLDYAGLVLVTDPATPAFALYRDRGFRVESRFPFATGELCWMRWARAPV